MKKLIRTTIIVHGDVQKGDYRGRVIKIAKKMGVDDGVSSITGVVQNLKNEHEVKIITEGDSRDIDWFEEKIKIRNFLINVTHVERHREKDIEISEDEREYEDFNKVVGEGETDERLDKAAELLKDLAGVMGNGFKHATDEMEKGFKEQREYSAKLDTYIFEQREHNKRMDSFIGRMDEHNLRLDKILEKLSEK